MPKLRSILLIDDDKATNFINRILIQKSELSEELLISKNGKEAIELIRQLEKSRVSENVKLPDLILLDINMPVMDGFSFLEAFSKLDLEQRSEIVIAILTTSLNPKDLEKVKSYGIHDFINKPLTKTSLKELVSRHFDME